jgi:hypothetical protein
VREVAPLLKAFTGEEQRETVFHANGHRDR